MDDLRKLLGEKVKCLRKRLALTQGDLARSAGFPTHQVISEIERGGRDVKAWELARLASALRTDIRHLLNAVQPKTDRVLWRDNQEEGAAVVEADFLNWCDQYYQLEKMLDVTPLREMPSHKLDPHNATFADARRMASDVAKTLDLGSRPASSLIAVLEGDYGVKIKYENLGDAGSAASAAGEFGIGILMHRSQAPWRRNFSFAHELFHLVTRDSIEQDQMRDDPRMQEWVEKLAESFAANLLLPEDVLIGEIDALVQNNKISYGDLISLARDFDTSTSALVWRLVNCKRLSTNEANRILQDDNFKAADRSTMAGKWSEPAPLSERFVRLAFRAFKKERVSRSRLAQLLGTSLFDLDSFLSDYGFQEADDYEAEATVA